MLIKLRQTRVIALLLTIVLLISSVPLSSYALESTKSIVGINDKVSDFDEAECEAILGNETQNNCS